MFHRRQEHLASVGTFKIRYTNSTLQHNLKSSMSFQLLWIMLILIRVQSRIRLQLVRPSSSVSLNVTVYPVSENLSSDHHVMTSGAYDDPITGVVTPLTSLAKGKYWVIPSTYNPEMLTSFQLIVFSTLASIELAPKQVSETWLLTNS